MHSNPNYYVIVLIIKKKCRKSIAQNQKKEILLKYISCLLVFSFSPLRHIASFVGIGPSDIRATT